MIKELVRKNRSYRRFDESESIPYETLRELVDLARLSPSAANLQPLKYFISNEAELNTQIFTTLAWAGYLKDWSGPAVGERPAAYIVILGDTGISKSIDCDHGIAAQSMLLGAVACDLGGCILGAIRRNDLREILNLDERYQIKLVLALGKPVETVVIEDVEESGNIRYWRDSDQIHHVPKRTLDELLVR